MSGLKLVIPTTFTDASLPILRDDPVLFTGSLLLTDMAHPANPLVGVPVNAGTVPNIAHAECAATLALSDTGFPSVFTINGAINNGVKGKIERTTKGGLHVIVSQAPGIAVGDGAKLDAASQIRTYIYTNRALHEFYVSRWYYLTRIAGIPGNFAGVPFEIGNGGSGNLMVRATPSVGWEIPAGGATPAGTSRYGGLNVAGASLATVKTLTTFSNLVAAPNNVGPIWGMPTGTWNAGVAGWAPRLPSFVTYRTYIEDLTVSGRTWAAVDALDLAEYTKQVLTAGGRYYADVFTDPATIP